MKIDEDVCALLMNTDSQNSITIEDVRVIGEGAKGRLLRQIMADVYGTKILCPLLLEEATSLGAAIAGGIGTGIFKNFRVAERLVKIVEVQSPRPLARERYEKLYPIFKNAYKALVPIYEQIASLK